MIQNQRGRLQLNTMVSCSQFHLFGYNNHVMIIDLKSERSKSGQKDSYREKTRT